jgi:hypothetical protein
VEVLSNLAPEDVSAESRFLLKINYIDLATFHMETQKYWTLAVRAAIHAKTLEQAGGARSKQIRRKNNSKIKSRKKMGIVAIKQQIRQDGHHKKNLATKNQPGRRTATNLPLENSFSRGPIQRPSRQFLSPTNSYASPTDSISKACNVSEATQLACYWLYRRT